MISKYKIISNSYQDSVSAITHIHTPTHTRKHIKCVTIYAARTDTLSVILKLVQWNIQIKFRKKKAFYIFNILKIIRYLSTIKIIIIRIGNSNLINDQHYDSV